MNDNKVEDTLRGMKFDFRERGYLMKLIDTQRNKVLKEKRHGLLHAIRKERTMTRIPFVSTYNNLSTTITGILRKHWNIISRSYTSIEDFRVPPLMPYRTPRNLKDRLVKTEVSGQKGSVQKFLQPQKTGSYPCLNCVNCKLMQKGGVFTHPTTLKEIQIRHFLTCDDSDWVVYVLRCPCDLLYVGETTCTIKTHLNGHRYIIRKKTIGPAGLKVFCGSRPWGVGSLLHYY